MIKGVIVIGAFFVGFISALVSGMSTGGALISIPGVIFLGASPLTAIATTRLSAIAGGISATIRYQKAKAINWTLVIPLLLVSVAGGVVGPRLLESIDNVNLQPVIGIILILMLPVLLLNRNLGTMARKTSQKNKILGTVLLFLIMIFATMFGVGGGTFLIYALIYFFGMTVIQANAAGMVMWFVGAFTAFISYSSKGYVDYKLGIPLFIGAAIGGYIGANIAVKKGAAWVKWLLCIVIVLSSIKLIFFSR